MTEATTPDRAGLRRRAAETAAPTGANTPAGRSPRRRAAEAATPTEATTPDRRSLRRRTLLLLAAGAPAVVAAGSLAACGASVSPVIEPSAFDRPLTIPPLAESTVAADGTRVFTLEAREGTSRFLDEATTATWGFNGDFLGPTLRAERGERVAVEVTNSLPETTSVHWHGMHLPAAMDGGPHQSVEPGQTWRPEWTINQPGATLWYHPHPHGRTEQHVYKGLAGLFLLDDGETGAAGLPSEYGLDDVPVIVQDKSFDDGELTIDDGGNEVGLLGSTIMVNGTIGAVLDVTTEIVRLRILNGSTARTYSFGFDDRSFTLVATDGGLLRAPVELDRIRLSPAERAEILVRMEPGTETMLHSFKPELGRVVVPFAVGGNDEFDVLRLRAADSLAPSGEPAAVFTEFGLDAAAATMTRSFELQDREINGQLMDMGRIDESVYVDTTEIWEVRNQDLSPHNFHVHDVQFEIVDIDGDAPPPELAGRKDTIYTEPQRTYRLVMRFEEYTDPAMPYMYHCHLLRHEDEGLMGQFVVLAPGEVAQPPEGTSAGGGSAGGGSGGGGSGGGGSGGHDH
ncbi:multicopper oxidase family protein [Occultella kanbiaonis]|uniref:multicopper oxidase family protein n=1 Tax=Occultella kanbiaonis TaxID=2675754 RepID=UPI0013D2CA76|nr:multicopper oxidase domain-containing protein [Occultella kanbiaonis]